MGLKAEEVPWRWWSGQEHLEALPSTLPPWENSRLLPRGRLGGAGSHRGEPKSTVSHGIPCMVYLVHMHPTWSWTIHVFPFEISCPLSVHKCGKAWAGEEVGCLSQQCHM